MATKAKTYTVQYVSSDPTSPTFEDGGKSELKKNDWIEILLNSAWPANSSITAVTIYRNKVVNGQDQKDPDNELGAWTSANGNGTGLAGIFSCSQAAGVVTVADVEDLTAGSVAKFWFAVSGTVGGSKPLQSWSVDPELINKAGTN